MEYNVMRGVMSVNERTAQRRVIKIHFNMIQNERGANKFLRIFFDPLSWFERSMTVELESASSCLYLTVTWHFRTFCFCFILILGSEYGSYVMALVQPINSVASLLANPFKDRTDTQQRQTLSLGVPKFNGRLQIGANFRDHDSNSEL